MTVAIEAGDYSQAAGYRGAHALFAAAPQPTAIFAANDLMALGALRAARGRGLVAGQDFALCGFDDIAIAGYGYVSLTTVSYSRAEMGRMRLLLQWQWHLEEVFVKINGETYIWRAVDHEGEVLEAFVSKRRDRKAALKFLRKTMKRFGRPRVIVTDKLRSYGATMKELGNAESHENSRWLNNRAENSHQPFRRRERAMLRFRQMRSLQKFAAVHSSVQNHFNQERGLYSRDSFKLNRAAALADWRQLAAA